MCIFRTRECVPSSLDPIPLTLDAQMFSAICVALTSPFEWGSDSLKSCTADQLASLTSLSGLASSAAFDRVPDLFRSCTGECCRTWA